MPTTGSCLFVSARAFRVPAAPFFGVSGNEGLPVFLTGPPSHRSGHPHPLCAHHAHGLGGVFTNVLAAPNAWPTEVLAPLFVCAGTEWLVPKSPVAFHSLGLLPVCIPFHSSRSLVWGGV